LSGCSSGHYQRPGIEEIKRDSTFFEMERPDGVIMPCLMYAERGTEGYAGFAWFDIDCDWDIEPVSSEENNDK
jgi:hypothetical protein